MMNNKLSLKTISLVVVGMAVFAQNSFAGFNWPANQEASQFTFKDETLITTYDSTPVLTGNVLDGGGHTPWSDTYWPDNDIGIAARYENANGRPTPQPKRSDVVLYDAVRPTQAEFLAMDPATRTAMINLMSPSEKMDIANGDDNYTLTKRVIKGLTGNAHYAYGICHGWSPASSNYPEPQQNSFVNANGIEVPFGSSDVKAAIEFYYAWIASEFDEKHNENWGFTRTTPSTYFQTDNNIIPFSYRQIGHRCLIGEDCIDKTISPMSLHLALHNIVGRYHRSFDIDANKGLDLWNYPVVGYASENKGESKPSRDDLQNAPTAVKKVLYVTDVYFADESDPTHRPNNGTAQASKIPDGWERIGVPLAKMPGNVDSRRLIYFLYVDANNNIVGGDWKPNGAFASAEKKNAHIGFAWRASRVPFRGSFDVLNKIYKPIETTVNSYADQLNYTPVLQDMFNPSNSTPFTTYMWLPPVAPNSSSL
jgi:hypothetical protein